jgi:hypothetical protein
MTAAVPISFARLFEHWLLSQCERDDLVGELARDYRAVGVDRDHPVSLTHKYLLETGSSPYAHAALDQARTEYRAEVRGSPR